MEFNYPIIRFDKKQKEKSKIEIQEDLERQKRIFFKTGGKIEKINSPDPVKKLWKPCYAKNTFNVEDYT